MDTKPTWWYDPTDPEVSYIDPADALADVDPQPGTPVELRGCAEVAEFYVLGPSDAGRDILGPFPSADAARAAYAERVAVVQESPS